MILNASVAMEALNISLKTRPQLSLCQWILFLYNNWYRQILHVISHKSHTSVLPVDLIQTSSMLPSFLLRHLPFGASQCVFVRGFVFYMERQSRWEDKTRWMSSWINDQTLHQDAKMEKTLAKPAELNVWFHSHMLLTLWLTSDLFTKGSFPSCLFFSPGDLNWMDTLISC